MYMFFWCLWVGWGINPLLQEVTATLRNCARARFRPMRFVYFVPTSLFIFKFFSTCPRLFPLPCVSLAVPILECSRGRQWRVLCQGFLQLQAWVSTKWSPINSFFSSLILIFIQYSVSKIHLYHIILQDSIHRHPGLEL